PGCRPVSHRAESCRHSWRRAGTNPGSSAHRTSDLPPRPIPEIRAWSAVARPMLSVNSNPIGRQKWRGADIKCIRAALERVERGRDILRPLDLRCDYSEVERAGRGLSLAHFLHGVGAAEIAQDRQRAETGENLAQHFEALAGQIGLLDRQAGDVPSWSR